MSDVDRHFGEKDDEVHMAADLGEGDILVKRLVVVVSPSLSSYLGKCCLLLPSSYQSGFRNGMSVTCPALPWARDRLLSPGVTYNLDFFVILQRDCFCNFL